MKCGIAGCQLLLVLVLVAAARIIETNQAMPIGGNAEMRRFRGDRGNGNGPGRYRSMLYRLRENHRTRRYEVEQGNEDIYTTAPSSRVVLSATADRDTDSSIDHKEAEDIVNYAAADSNSDTVTISGVKMVAESSASMMHDKPNDQFFQNQVTAVTVTGEVMSAPRHIRAAQKAATGFSAVVAAMTGSCDVRLLMLVFYASLGCLMPYIPMYYKYLNIDSSYIGIFGAITPAVTFIVSPLWGMLADITKKHKQIMLLTFIGSVLLRCFMVIKGNHLWLGTLVAAAAILNAPVKPLMDTAVMSTLKDRAEYGKSRLFGQVGFGVGAMAGGLYLGGNDLNNMFILHACMSVFAAYLMINFIPEDPSVPKVEDGLQQSQRRTNKTVKDKAATVDKSILSVLGIVMRRPEILIFFFMVFIIGFSSGVIENFAYVRLSEIGAAANVLGLCRLCSSMAGRIFVLYHLFLVHFVDIFSFYLCIIITSTLFICGRRCTHVLVEWENYFEARSEWNYDNISVVLYY